MYTHTAIIRGNGNFPLDMLRYDAAFPENETESGKMENTFYESERWEIKVSKKTKSKKPVNIWCHARWASFGCKVEHFRTA